MRSFLRATSRNPLLHTGDKPATAPWFFPFVATVVVATSAAALWANFHIIAQRETFLRNTLIKEGLGPAKVELVGWCNGVGPLFRWRTAKASGRACSARDR